MDSLIEMGKATIKPILSIKEDMYILENKIEQLSHLERDVQAELRAAEVLHGEKPKGEVELWFRNVQRIKNEFLNIKQGVGELRWFYFREQMKLSKSAKEKIKEVDKLRANRPFFNRFESTTKEFPPIKLVGETTALKHFKMIEECLMDDVVGKIGVFGIGGVGKTTTMTQIYNKIKNTNAFDRLIWVTVSRDSYLEELQLDVSKALGLDLKGHAIDRSAEIFWKFKSIGRFLLILDDMWTAFPLEEIGIPEPNEKNKCKIVWTTRSKKVCVRMGSHKIIKVEHLTEEESWSLFQEKLRDNVSPELEPIAKDVVKECGGLPLAIITVGAAMRDVHDIRIWRTALEELRLELRPSRTEIIGMEDNVFAILKYSFDRLESQILRDCFLYCALYPMDWQIGCEDLIEQWMADGLLDENEDREKAFDKGYMIINHLKDACMLESAGFDNFVKMHDLLRDLAIIITRKSPKFVVKTGLREKQFTWDENLMISAVRVSLMSSNIGTLSCPPKSCLELSTLLLQNSSLDYIHHLFFVHVHNLRVLDLSGTNIMCLPQSISNLVKLRALWLSQCERLEEVPSLAKLKELRVLILKSTSIKCLPAGLEGLTNLRCLDLTYTQTLETFPAGIIPNLSCLEELCMFSCKWKWSSNGNEGGACVKEMLMLMHLRKLYVHFAELKAFNCYVRSGRWRGLKYFCLHIGNEYDGDDYDDQTRRVSIFSINKCMNSLVLPDNTLELEINCSDDMTPLSEIPSLRSLSQLITCSITECKKMEYILTKDQKNPFLPTLNELVISDLLNLRSICKDPTPTEGGSLANLRTISIYNCPNLKYVFSIGWLQALQSLENISVSFCSQEMEEMIVETESRNNIDNTITLPRLRTFHLSNLWKLKSISKRIFVCNSLEEISVNSCPNLKKLPLVIHSIRPNLKRITGSSVWWDSLEWDNPDTQWHLQRFFSNIDDDGIDENDYDAKDEDDDYGGSGLEDDSNKIHVAADEEEKHGTKRKSDALM